MSLIISNNICWQNKTLIPSPALFSSTPIPKFETNRPNHNELLKSSLIKFSKEFANALEKAQQNPLDYCTYRILTLDSYPSIQSGVMKGTTDKFSVLKSKLYWTFKPSFWESLRKEKIDSTDLIKLKTFAEHTIDQVVNNCYEKQEKIAKEKFAMTQQHDSTKSRDEKNIEKDINLFENRFVKQIKPYLLLMPLIAISAGFGLAIGLSPNFWFLKP